MGGMVMGAKVSSLYKKLGAWLARAASTNYQAASDGFCLGIGTNPGGALVTAHTDGATPATVLRQSVTNSTPGLVTSVCCPVKKGDYWKVTGANVSVFWIPLGP